MDELRCHAFQYESGEVDLESIGETPEIVRDRVLSATMGWRYEHPDRYSREEAWKRILGVGRVVEVTVSPGVAAGCAGAR